MTALLAFVPKTSGLHRHPQGALFRGPSAARHWLVPDSIAKFLWIIAVLTMFSAMCWACWQHNIKRMLAYSSIAHSGYMLAGVTALVSTVSDRPGCARAACCSIWPPMA